MEKIEESRKEETNVGPKEVKLPVKKGRSRKGESKNVKMKKGGGIKRGKQNYSKSSCASTATVNVNACDCECDCEHNNHPHTPFVR